MLLQELFTQPLPYHITRSDKYDVMARFYDPDGNQYDMLLSKAIQLKPSDPNSWGMEFSTNVDEKPVVDLIGGRKSIPIMSTIVDFVKQFLKSRDDVDEIHFVSTANEPSRVKLYDRLAKQLAKYLGWKYLHVPFGGDHYFIISSPGVDQSRWKNPRDVHY